MYPRTLKRDSARGVLWGDREVILPHLLEHRCPVTTKTQELCEQAGWTFDSYLLAALFDRRDLITEITK